MILSKQNRITFRLRLIQLIALLFVIYAFADITVLQAYCGNESVGIPPAHHLSKNSSDSAEKEQQTEIEQDNLHESHNQEEFPQDCNDECCFCCSTHVVISNFAFEPSIFESEINQITPISYENKHSNTALYYLFRPPQIV